MLVTTRGIAVNTVRYSDNKLIVKVYTENMGMQAYVVHCGSKSRYKSRMFSQPAIIEIVALHKPGRELQQLKDVSYSFIPANIFVDIRKSAIALFIRELISACVREHEPNTALFQFFEKTLVNLDVSESGLSVFHLRFMTGFASFLGFMPENSYSETNTYFDMAEGLFVQEPPGHIHYMNHKESMAFHKLINDAQSLSSNCISFNRELRDEMLHLLIDFYKIQLPGMGKVNSYKILKEVMSD